MCTVLLPPGVSPIAVNKYSVIKKDGYTWSAGAFSFTQTAYLLKLVIPTTNALPRWKLNVEDETHAAQQSPTQF